MCLCYTYYDCIWSINVEAIVIFNYKFGRRLETVYKSKCSLIVLTSFNEERPVIYKHVRDPGVTQRTCPCRAWRTFICSKDTLEFCLRQSGVWNGTNSVLGGAVMMIRDIRSLFSVPMMVFISSQGPLLYKCIHLYNATLTRRSQVDLDHLLCMVFPWNVMSLISTYVHWL